MRFMDIAAVIACAISGGLDARRSQMDFVGVYFVAMATALAGGTMRDTLLGRFPVFWVSDASYALTVLAAAVLVAALYKRNVLERKHAVLMITVFDAIGLGLFSMIGATYAQQAGAPFFPAVLIGVVNGIMGGILRDVLCNQIPVVFKTTSYLYATCSFAGAVAYLALFAAGVPQTASFAAGIVLTFVIRIVAVRYKIGLPV